MSLRNHTHLKLIGAVGAAALAIGTVAAPAVAAKHDLTYTCATLGQTAVTFNTGKLPKHLVAGQTDKRAMSQTIHLSDAQGLLAKSIGNSVSGKLTAKGGGGTLPFSMKIPSTTLNGGAQDIPASGTGTLHPTKAGTMKVSLGKMSAALVLSGGAGGTTPVSDTCAAPTDGTQKLGTIAVGKDKTKTAASASYSSKKHSVTGSAKVKSHFGLKPTGKVTFTLMRGTHKVATQKGKLNKKGVAKAAFKHVTKKGDYALVAKYAGNKNLKGSSSGQPFVV